MVIITGYHSRSGRCIDVGGWYGSPVIEMRRATGRGKLIGRTIAENYVGLPLDFGET